MIVEFNKLISFIYIKNNDHKLRGKRENFKYQ